MNSDRFRPRGNTPSPDFKMDEDAIRQQEEWINRAFGLATDVAKGMSSSPQEAKETDEAIRQSKEWVDNVFGFARDVSSGGVYSSVRSDVLQDDDDTFQVALDVPGVKPGDIDVTVEGTRDKILVIRGQRDVGQDEEARKFSKVISLDSRSDTEKLSANLENGVLLVTVPRIAIENTESIQKVAVSKVSDESKSSSEETDTFPFELELDVPGVSASNIDITVAGDTDKTLTITAIRELGKDSEGNPRKKETSKSFKVDELVDTSKIVANLNNGVLKVSAPADIKKTKETVRRIEVKPASASEPSIAMEASSSYTGSDAVDADETDLDSDEKDS